MRFVAGGATLFESRLVQVLLLVLLSLVSMARKADIHGVRLREARAFAGVRIVAVDAIALRARVLNLGGLDLLGLLFVAAEAECFRILLRQDDFSVLGSFVASGAGILVAKRCVYELLNQFWPRRLMRIVTSQAIGRAKRLAIVRLDELSVFHIVTVDAECGSRLRQMEVKLHLSGLTGLMRDVAGVATHVERGVTAAALGDIDTRLMARQAKVFIFIYARGRLQQVVLVVRRMRIVAFQAVAYRWTVNFTFDFSGVFVGVAGNAEGLGGGGDQFRAGDVFIYPDLVTACTSCGDCRVNHFPLRFIFMTFETFGRVDVLIQGHWMLAGERLS